METAVISLAGRVPPIPTLPEINIPFAGPARQPDYLWIHL